MINFTTGTVCLCTRHQNMALKLLRIVDAQNPDVFVKKIKADADVDAVIRKITETVKDKMTYDIWKKLIYRQGTV